MSGTLKCFQLCFNVLTLDSDTILRVLDSAPTVVNWYTLLPGQIFFVSKETVSTLTAQFGSHFPQQLFTITQIAAIDGSMLVESSRKPVVTLVTVVTTSPN